MGWKIWETHPCTPIVFPATRVSAKDFYLCFKIKHEALWSLMEGKRLVARTPPEDTIAGVQTGDRVPRGISPPHPHGTPTFFLDCLEWGWLHFSH